MKMLIGGNFVSSTDKSTIKVINPATMETIDTVPSATKDDVDMAVQNARKGFLEWSSMPMYKRIDILYKFADIVETRYEELAQIETKQSGKTITMSRDNVLETAYVFRGYCEKARNFNGEVLQYDIEDKTENDLIITVREPVGVVGCIVPFNYPAVLYAHKVAPALVAGNAVIIKPASDTPLGNILLTQWLVEAGVPGNAAQIITGSGSKVGKWLVDNPLVDMITVTGSTEVGIEIMTGCSKNLHHCHLELGGNDPLIVFDDCDLDLAVKEAIEGRCANAGQTCCACKRFIIQNTVKEKFIEKLIEGLKKVNVGDPSLEDTECGPLINERAAINVTQQIEHAVSQGAKCIFGGKRFKHTFIEPTLLKDVTPDMDIARDMEVFGPVFPVIGFDTMQEALEIANNIPFGLQGGVMTNDMKKALHVSRYIQCGCCVINGSGFYRSSHQAFGGTKMTGIGREGIAYTLEEMTHKKTIAFKKVFEY